MDGGAVIRASLRLCGPPSQLTGRERPSESAAGLFLISKLKHRRDFGPNPPTVTLMICLQGSQSFEKRLVTANILSTRPKCGNAAFLAGDIFPAGADKPFGEREVLFQLVGSLHDTPHFAWLAANLRLPGVETMAFLRSAAKFISQKFHCRVP